MEKKNYIKPELNFEDIIISDIVLKSGIIGEGVKPNEPQGDYLW